AGDSPSPIGCNAIRRISSSAARDTKRPSLFRGPLGGMDAATALTDARCHHRSRDTPLTRPWGLDGTIHAANGPAIGEDIAPDSWLMVLLSAKNTAPGSLPAAG
ncbi:hypothetical protein DXO248_16345, partial [Xanthomonas oryzae pv. oryzae]